MPPSGYSRAQAAHLEAFLASCLVALSTEAAEHGLGLGSALTKEIDDIDYEIAKTNDEYALGALTLTRAFYVKLHEILHMDDTLDLSALRTRGLEALRTSVLGIHIIR